MEDKYYVLTGSEDGDIRIEEFTEAEIQNRINDEDYGGDEKWLDKIEGSEDPLYWGPGGIIIKGRIVTPKAKTVVTEFEIE